MSLASPFEIVCVTSAQDPALDEAEMLAEIELANGRRVPRVAAYLATRDPAHLRFIPGKEPVWYRLRAIRARELNALVSDPLRPTGEELWTIAQRCLEGVRGATLLTLREDDFRVLDAKNGLRMLTDAAFDRVAEEIGIAGVRELGQAVLTRAQPRSALAPFDLRLG